MAGVKDIRAAVERARALARGRGRADRAVPRRGAPLQQGAAGHVPAVRRGRHADLHRRHHRESLVRGHQRVAVARARLRAQGARRRRTSRAAASARSTDRERGLGAAGIGDRRRTRSSCWRRRPTAMRGARSTCWSSPADLAAAARRTTHHARAGAARSPAGGRRRFDKGGEQFYDQISALHKAVRGSDPDAALYWLCAHARRRLRSALPRAARRAHGDARTSGSPIRARCTHGARGLGGLRAAGQPEGELALAAGGGVPGRAPPRATRCTRRSARRRRMSSSYGTLEVPLHASQCADAADEGAGLRQRLSLRARRAGRLRRRRALSAGRAARPALLSSRCRAAWRSRSARRWRGCAQRIRMRRSTQTATRKRSPMIDPKLLRSDPEDVAAQSGAPRLRARCARRCSALEEAPQGCAAREPTGCAPSATPTPRPSAWPRARARTSRRCWRAARRSARELEAAEAGARRRAGANSTRLAARAAEPAARLRAGRPRRERQRRSAPLGRAARSFDFTPRDHVELGERARRARLRGRRPHCRRALRR